MFDSEQESLDLDPFGLKQSPLQRRGWLGDPDFASGSDHSMPRNSLAARTRGHGVARGTCSATQLDRFRDGSVRCYAAPGDLFHELVNWRPGHIRHSNKSIESL